MKGEKPEVNMPICPMCGKPLNQVSECYATIGVDYKLVGNKYQIVSEPIEKVAFTCKQCGKPLPEQFVNNTILKMLPQV